MSKIVIASFLSPGGRVVLFVQNYQKYSKNYFLLGQQLSTIKDNSRSQIAQIKQTFFKATLRGGGERYAVGETTIPRLESRDCFDYYAPRRMGLVDLSCVVELTKAT